MEQTEPIWIFESWLDLSMKEAEDTLLSVREGDFNKDTVPFILSGKGNCSITKKDDVFTARFDDGHKEFITLDRDLHTITVKGQWWYCGVFTIINAAPRTRISLQVYNVAESSGFLVPMMLWNKKLQFRKNFDKFIEALHKRAK